MEIPSPIDGVVHDIAIKVGDKVAQDSVICSLTTSESVSVAAPTPISGPETKPTPAPEVKPVSSDSIYASPGVRRLARELNIDLKTITPTGEKGRVTKDDLNNVIKNRLQSGAAGFAVEPMPTVDFSQFGP